ncbi:hypothetical protein HZH68_005402 [Vespula germanica]|uniref:Uncharacterized protein n=1 Tax=Vespula germanica TaxID=30212 RepID=A0A834KG21_VESGE|nr:hypothetical protein HZH68_005402 [Vespula germanica]
MQGGYWLMNLKINFIEDCSLHRAATYQGNVRVFSLEERSHGNGIPRAKFELHLPANRGIMFYDSVRLLPVPSLIRSLHALKISNGSNGVLVVVVVEGLKEVRQKEETKRDGESLPSKDSNTD